MQGIVFTGDQRVELLDFPDPQPGPHDVVLRIDASGICGSDLHTFHRRGVEGTYQSVDPRETRPIIAGHEPVGTVVDRGTEVTDDEARLGLQAICFHYSGCNTCRYCLEGRPQLCSRMVGYGGTTHGGHAEFLVVPAATLVPLPEGLSAKAGACLACGTGTAYGALRRLRRIDQQNLLVVGLGPVGMSAVAYASAMGARVIATDLDAARREAALSFGADQVLDPRINGTIEEIRDLTGGYGVDASIETSGSTPGRSSALRSVRPEGETVFVGLGGGNMDVAMDSEVVLAPRSIIGSRTFSKGELIEATQLAVELNIPLEKMVSAEFAMTDAQEAYEQFAAGAVGKYVLVGSGA